MIVTAALFATMTIPSANFVSIQPNVDFPVQGSVTQTFGPFVSPIDFNEAIVSWNVEHPDGAAVKVQARAVEGGKTTKWYTVGDWASNVHLHPRASVTKQGDEDGDVDTDTLHLKHPGQSVELSITMQTLAGSAPPKLKLLSVCFSDTGVNPADTLAASPAWGKTIDVPQRAQNNYPNGGVLCSATSVSMLLWHYSNVLNRPELNRDVPEVEAGVWDSVYKGAGNWPFNTAYAGSFPGMRAYVSRFNTIDDLEKWIDSGIPVACSVSFLMLQGKPLTPAESGHLVVLVGFTKDGDPVFNDPAFKDSVRRSYKRADFQKAWDYGHRTVYLIYPEGTKLPPNTDGLWASE